MDFTSNYLSTPFEFSPLYHCVTNIRNEYLVILGKDNDVQILETQSKLWLNSVPSLLIGRRFASCNYINDKLFIIGGEDTTSIEYLDVSTTSMMNIESASWKYNNDPLPYPITASRSIAVIDDILVIGGYNGAYLNTVYIINSNTESVSLGAYLYKGISKSCVVFVNGIIYSFGGNTGASAKWDGWQTTSVTISASVTEPPGDIITTSTSTTKATNSITTQNEPYTVTSDPMTSSMQTTSTSTTEPTAVISTTSVAISASVTEPTNTIQTLTSTTKATNSMTTQNEPTSDPITAVITTTSVTTSASTTERISDIIASSDPITSIINTLIQTTNHESRNESSIATVWLVLLLIACGVCGVFLLLGCIVLVKSRENQEVYDVPRKRMWVQKAKNEGVHDDDEMIPGQVNEHNILEMRKGESSVSKQSMHGMEGMEQPTTTKGGEVESQNITGETVIGI